MGTRSWQIFDLRRSLLLSAAFVSCSRQPEPGAVELTTAESGVGDVSEATADAWMRFSPDETPPRRGVTPIAVERVQPDSIARAVAMLKDAPARVLSSAEAEKLVGHPVECAGSDVVVLLRCIDMERGGPEEDSRQVDEIEAFESAGVVAVIASGWRFEDQPIRPCPVVAVLPCVPVDVFVELAYTHPARGEDEFFQRRRR